LTYIVLYKVSILPEPDIRTQIVIPNWASHKIAKTSQNWARLKIVCQGTTIEAETRWNIRGTNQNMPETRNHQKQDAGSAWIWVDSVIILADPIQYTNWVMDQAKIGLGLDLGRSKLDLV
jgi:hypothetical protein